MTASLKVLLFDKMLAAGLYVSPALVEQVALAAGE